MARFNAEQPSFQDFRSVVRERTNPVVAWVGAGLSRPAGLPLWPDLRDGLLQDLGHRADATTDPARKRKLQNRMVSIRADADLWQAFSNLKAALGGTEYSASIRRRLNPANTSRIPAAYEHLWRMDVSGILSLNLDPFSRRAFASVHSGKNYVEFDGRDVNERVLKNSTPFIANLHGNLEDYRTWVFTTADLRRLLADPRYRMFMTNILCTRTVLFLGLTVDDPAVSAHFEFLDTIRFRPGEHYWLTERTDARTASFADRKGIRTILFDASFGDYSGVSEFFSAIEGFVPQDDSAPPPSRSVAGASTEVPPAAELCRMDAEDIRWQLNLRATEILAPGDEAAYAAYEAFCNEYNQAIYRAWFVSTDGDNNTLLGYKVLDEVKHPGAFGRVFRAQGPDGRQVAVKVLHESIRRDPERLQSFRRGARAMQILTDHKLPGMVRFKEACEIPAMVVMDWVEGPNLRQAVELHYVDDWKTLLHIGAVLAQTIRSAHKLPERVLHRDVRPPNIMLENRYVDDLNWNLVVLDFDLSWHKDSIEKSISSATSPAGYLAPEQLLRRKGISTRNAAVDSFGLGMTLFYMVSRRDPMPNEHVMHGWETTIRAACSAYADPSWQCIPYRIARLILKATRDGQPERCDVAFIERELNKLCQLESGDTESLTTLLFAEEIAARTGHGYLWDSDQDTAILTTARGLSITLHGDEASGKVCGMLRWAQEHAQEYEKVKKYLPRRSDAAQRILDAGSWETAKDMQGAYGVSVRFVAKLTASTKRISALSAAVSGALMEIAKIS